MLRASKGLCEEATTTSSAFGLQLRSVAAGDTSKGAGGAHAWPRLTKKDVQTIAPSPDDTMSTVCAFQAPRVRIGKTCKWRLLANSDHDIIFGALPISAAHREHRRLPWLLAALQLGCGDLPGAPGEDVTLLQQWSAVAGARAELSSELEAGPCRRMLQRRAHVCGRHSCWTGTPAVHRKHSPLSLSENTS